MTYQFKYRYRRRLFYRSHSVVGHAYNKEMDRMALYLPNGGVIELPQWSLCSCKLGTDWVLAVKKDMETKSGQKIVINKDIDAH